MARGLELELGGWGGGVLHGRSHICLEIVGGNIWSS